jgi:myo-inositol-1(or 4)-monophosphatase
MTYFGRDPHVIMKDGNSPVTEADLAADMYLRETLLAARPDYGWLSEETADNADRLTKRRCFIVDPIDGTKAFIAGRSQWCVSVGLVEDGVPIAGVLDCPVRGEVFESNLGGGAFLNGKAIGKSDWKGAPRFAGHKNWLQTYALKHGVEPEQIGHIPSLAYRVACVADRRFEGTFIKPDCHDWDIAAAALILSETGGALLEQDGSPARFNGQSPRHGFMIAADRDHIKPMLAVVAAHSIG